jgi:hypothetical protein
MREGTGAILVLADDPAAESELAALAAERGWDYARVGPQRFQLSSGEGKPI